MSSGREDIQNLMEQFHTINSAFVKFSNTLREIHECGALTQDSSKLIDKHHQELKKAVSSFTLPGKQTTRKRPRQLSGEITLDELRNSIDISEETRVPSVIELQRHSDIFDKLKLLFTWEGDTNRTNIRVAFHQGFDINELLTDKDNSYTIESIHQTTSIPEFNIRKNLQLFKELGTYRMLLYSTLPVSKFQRNIASIRTILSSLPEEEKRWWQTYQKKSTDDPSCFIECYLDWFKGKQLPNNVFYKLDLLDNRMDHPTAEQVIEKLCTRVMVCDDQHDMTKKSEALSEERYLLGYFTKKDEPGHFTILKRDPSDGKYFSDETTNKDFQLSTPWAQTIIYLFK